MKELAEWILEFISKHPKHAKECNDYFVLCQDEIENGESKENEIELCKGAILDLLEY